jgi:hypothetical protein
MNVLSIREHILHLIVDDKNIKSRHQHPEVMMMMMMMMIYKKIKGGGGKCNRLNLSGVSLAVCDVVGCK